MNFIFNKQTGEVRMIGNAKYDKKIMGEIKLDPSIEEQEKINRNWKIYIVDKKLQFKLPEKQERQEKLKETVEAIEKAKTVAEIKTNLINLIELIK